MIVGPPVKDTRRKIVSESMAFRELHYRWVFHLQSTPESLWPFVADTNRFNRDTGVPRINVDTSKKPLRNARRKVRLSIYGMDVEWEEQPFEWVRPVRFGIERVYSRGPMARMRARAELTPGENGGTLVTYEVHATPRNLIGVVAIPLQLRLNSAPKFRAAFKKYDKLASTGVDASLGDSSVSLPTVDHSRINALGERLLNDSDQEQLPEVKTIVDRLL